MQELMPVSNISVALDIGTSRVCIVVAEKDEFGKLAILGKACSPSDGLRRATVVNINKTVAAIQAAVAEVERVSQVVVHGVNVSLSGAHVHCIQSTSEISINQSGVVNESDVTRFLEKARSNIQNLDINHEIIHVIPQEFIVDDQDRLLDPIGMAGTTMRGSAYIVVGLRTNIRNIRQCIEKAGLKVGGLTFQPVASGLGVIREGENKGGVVVVDIGAGTTEIAVYNNGAIHYSEVITIAANDVTLDIAHGVQVPEEVAEQLKIKYGCADTRFSGKDEEIVIESYDGKPQKTFPKNSLHMIVEARMMEIFELVKDSLMSTGYYDDINAGVIITGGGSLLPGVVELARHVLGLDVRIGYPEGLSSESKAFFKSPIDSTVIGLAAHVYRNNKAVGQSFATLEPLPETPPQALPRKIQKVKDPTVDWKKVVDGFQDWWAKL